MGEINGGPLQMALSMAMCGVICPHSGVLLLHFLAGFLGPSCERIDGRDVGQIHQTDSDMKHHEIITHAHTIHVWHRRKSLVNVGKYTIHGFYGSWIPGCLMMGALK